MGSLKVVDSVKVTVLVEDAVLKDNLWATHGISFYIETKAINKKTNILFDIGPSYLLLKHNLKTLNISLSKLDYLLISHEHEDHTGALDEFLTDHKTLPVITHPDTLSYKCSFERNGYKFRGVINYRKILKEYKHLTFTKSPLKISDGIITTGEIDRTAKHEKWKWKKYYKRVGGKNFKDIITNEQALILNLKNKGLVIITGCTHSGIINLIWHAQKITKVKKIYAIIGGFHLKIRGLNKVKQTIKELAKIKPALIAPCHCTDFQVIKELDDKFDLAISDLGHFSTGEELLLD